MKNTEFLPLTAEDLQNKNIDSVDFVCVTGDAYVDHPSFGIAIISRLLESKGYSVAILAQPNVQSINDFKIFDRPNLGFLVTSGNIDSMVNNYTVAKKKREKDLYSENGEFGKRPDRACIAYSKKIREAYPESPIILGGLEASLRRFSHYDYWDDKIRKSILMDSLADIIVYGMGERQMVEIAEALQSGIPVSEITFINGTVYKTKDKSRAYNAIELPSYDEVKATKASYAQSYFLQYSNTDHILALPLIEKYDEWHVVSNTPAAPLATEELDNIYALPYTRTYHPKYTKGIPAIEEVKYSIASSRGCFGACSFCALNYHQGRVVQSRSHESIIAEAESFTSEKDFKGYIHDVGGPTANFRSPACERQKKHGVCKNKMCLYPKPCKNLKIDHSEFTKLLQNLRKIPKIKKVFIRSGIRFDYLINDTNDEFFYELCEHHISGQLKVAPEHVSDTVLKYMGKPSKDVYDKFVKKYTAINKKISKEQYIVPYLMSSHPGSDLKAAIELAEYLRDMKISPQQVQDFYPTPGTISTCMYYTGLDPRDMTKVFVAKTPKEKAMQRALIQYRLPQNYELVHEALTKANRRDLIGYDKKCLIRPRANKFQPKETPKPTPKKIKKTIRNVHKKKI